MTTLKTLFQILVKVSVEKETSSPLIVGGVPRDRVLGTLKKTFNDIDITTCDHTVFTLAKEFSIESAKYINNRTKLAKDGHISVFFPKLKMDFSSNFRIPNIDKILHNQGMSNPSNSQQELFSRDFFCNTLLMSLDFKRIKDITQNAVKDIKNKIIRTCLEPELTFKYNTKRIIRVIYLAAKLDFNVDQSIINWVSQNQRYIYNIEQEYITKNINNALMYDANKTIWLINKMDLWDYLPITEGLLPYYKQRIVTNV